VHVKRRVCIDYPVWSKADTTPFLANALLKRARDVQRALEPKSKIHVEADAVQLRAQVVLLQQLVQELPPGSVHEVDDDLRMAVEVGSGLVIRYTWPD
jgi:hypothetical protein